ncbi:MAG: ABC transporter ATP-binding protein [Candidatus Hydrogenedentota bacterium]
MHDNGEIARIENLCKTYVMGMVTVEALRGITVSFRSGEYIGMMGPSGCGKSTLLNILGCLDKPSGGRYFLGPEDVSQLDDDRLSDIRSSRLGFVFQSYNLIQQLSVVENIEVPLYYQGVHEDESRERAKELAARVGLESRFDHKPYELSGGQQQRVAIARALVNDPLIILADEPTGNLDSASGRDIMRLFDELHALGKTVIMVTHSEEVSERAERIIRLRDGEVEHDLKC